MGPEGRLKTVLQKGNLLKIPIIGKLKIFPKILIAFILLVLFGGIGLSLGLIPPAVMNSVDFLPIPGISKKAADAKEEAQGHIYRLEPFIVNLADPGQVRFLKIKIDLESGEAKPNEEFERRIPQLRDTILTILCSKQAQEILNISGKQVLREEIKKSANQVLRKSRVKAVYITEFMIQ